MNDKILPLGSVVLLKGATKPIIVIGYLTMDSSNSKVWDYMACPYPVGVMGMDQNFVFQKESIEKVIFEGYQDEEGKKFLDDMKKYKEENNM